MQEQYKDLWISAHATPGYPAGHNLTPGATVLYQRPDNSVVGLTRLDVRNFTFEDREVAELFGLELARLIVDTATLSLCVSGIKPSRLLNGNARNRLIEGGKIRRA